MLQEFLQIRQPYLALTSNPKGYNDYLLTKGYANAVVCKDGFIKKSEIQKVADVAHISKNAMVNRLNNLVATGYISKNKYGYTLTSRNKINSQLKLTKTKNGVEKTPFIKIDLAPAKVNNYQLELMKMYYLIIQIFSRRNFIVNGKKIHRKLAKKILPENFELSLEKIMIRGNYKSKMQVRKLVYDLAHIGLLNIVRGKKNESSGYYDCNKYSLLPLSKVDWSKLETVNENLLSRKEKFNLILESKIGFKKKKSESLRLKKPKIKIQYNDAEILFRKLAKKELGKNLNRQQISNALATILNDSKQRKNLFTVIKPEQIQVEFKEGYFYDARLKTPCYDRYHFFKYHHISLVTAAGSVAGNFIDFEDEYLVRNDEKKKEIQNSIMNRKQGVF